MSLDNTVTQIIIDSINVEEYKALFAELISDVVRSDSFKEGFAKQLLHSDVMWHLQADLLEQLKNNIGPIQAKLVFTNDI